jgi:hypothetical protein
LSEVVDDFREWTGVNIVLDATGLDVAGVEASKPVIDATLRWSDEPFPDGFETDWCGAILICWKGLLFRGG